jgi:hypothetical protein
MFRHARECVCIVLLLTCLSGCDQTHPYGLESALEIPNHKTEVWAVAPAVNLSGHREVDAILQADLLYQQLQQVKGMTVVPVDRVVQVLEALNTERIDSVAQAKLVCDLLHVDALVVPTVTAYDPYLPPKMGASLALFRRGDRTGTPRQAVGMFDSMDGTIRKNLLIFANGRSDPNGPMAEREYFLSMDRYTGFVYHELIADLLGVPAEPVADSDDKR